MKEVVTISVEETRQVAEELARGLSAGSLLALYGDLGSGKTCFVSGIARALGVNEPVTSPTFTIINEYSGNLPLYHMDLYRISHPDELFGLDLNAYFNADGITVIEWPERAGDLLPAERINIEFAVLEGQSRRRIRISGGNAEMLKR